MGQVGRSMIGAFGLAFALAACASAHARNAPDWFRQAERTEQHGYPSLRSVPHTSDANTDAAHWAQVQADMAAAKQQLQSSPRSEPAPPQDPNGFITDAQAAIEATRASHPDK